MSGSPPGVDYLVSGKETAAQVRQQIDAAFASLKEWEFNTLLLPLLKDGKGALSFRRL